MDWLTSMADSRFLALYWVLVGVAVLVATLAPVVLPRPRPRDRVRHDDLGPYELAMLSGGPRRVVDTALDGLLAVGAAKVTGKGTIVPGGARSSDRVQRYVLSRICHNRRLTRGRDDLGVCHRAAGRAVARRLRSVGYLVRRRAGARLHWLLVAVMTLGMVRVVAEHGLEWLANTAVVVGIMVSMSGFVLGVNAVEVRWPTGGAVTSRRQVRAVAGFLLVVSAVDLLVMAPDNAAGQTLASVIGTAALWWVLRSVLRRTTGWVATDRGRAVLANIEARTVDDRIPA
jgi:uncharacterized protein (TIGR04222 family)